MEDSSLKLHCSSPGEYNGDCCVTGCCGCYTPKLRCVGSWLDSPTICCIHTVKTLFRWHTKTSSGSHSSKQRSVSYIPLVGKLAMVPMASWPQTHTGSLKSHAVPMSKVITQVIRDEHTKLAYLFICRWP